MFGHLQVIVPHTGHAPLRHSRFLSINRLVTHFNIFILVTKNIKRWTQHFSRGRANSHIKGNIKYVWCDFMQPEIHNILEFYGHKFRKLNFGTFSCFHSCLLKLVHIGCSMTHEICNFMVTLIWLYLEYYCHFKLIK